MPNSDILDKRGQTSCMRTNTSNRIMSRVTAQTTTLRTKRTVRTTTTRATNRTKTTKTSLRTIRSKFTIGSSRSLRPVWPIWTKTIQITANGSTSPICWSKTTYGALWRKPHKRATTSCSSRSTQPRHGRRITAFRANCGVITQPGIFSPKPGKTPTTRSNRTCMVMFGHCAECGHGCPNWTFGTEGTKTMCGYVPQYEDNTDEQPESYYNDADLDYFADLYDSAFSDQSVYAGLPFDSDYSDYEVDGDADTDEFVETF